MELAVYLIPTLVALGCASAGWMREGARSYLPFLISLVTITLSAGACWLIGANKTGGSLAGIVGTLMAMLLCVGAVGLLVGAVLRWLHEMLHLRITQQPAPWRHPPTRPWDVYAMVAMSAIAIGLSVMEYSR